MAKREVKLGAVVESARSQFGFRPVGASRTIELFEIGRVRREVKDAKTDEVLRDDDGNVVTALADSGSINLFNTITFDAATGLAELGGMKYDPRTADVKALRAAASRAFAALAKEPDIDSARRAGGLDSIADNFDAGVTAVAATRFRQIR